MNDFAHLEANTSVNLLKKDDGQIYFYKEVDGKKICKPIKEIYTEFHE